MKKTLYQILGVDPKASAQDIAAAYSMRLEEYKVATIRDPNKLVVLQQAKEILTDATQRAAYDVSLAGRVERSPGERKSFSDVARRFGSRAAHERSTRTSPVGARRPAG